jgi:hypothetical protein
MPFNATWMKDGMCADTTVISGRGWETVLVYPHSRANLVGFDDKAQRKGLPIVAAHSVVKIDSGDEVLIVVYNAVLNQSASTSLMSKYQVRDFGLVWDPVSTCMT